MPAGPTGAEACKGRQLATTGLLVFALSCASEEHPPYWLGEVEPGMCEPAVEQWMATLTSLPPAGGETDGLEVDPQTIVLRQGEDVCVVGAAYCDDCSNSAAWMELTIPGDLERGVYELDFVGEGPYLEAAQCIYEGAGSSCGVGGGSVTGATLVLERGGASARGCLLDMQGQSVDSLRFEVASCE